MRIEHLNRATPDGFMSYMTARPHYFKDLSGLKATPKNIETYFRDMEAAGLVAAAGLPSGCYRNGHICSREATECRTCEVFLARERAPMPRRANNRRAA